MLVTIMICALRAVGASRAAAPSHEELQKASAELQNGKLSVDSLALFERAVEHNPQDWRAHAMLGQALRHDREKDGALTALTRAFELAPHVEYVSLLLARAHRDMSHRQEAMAMYRTTLSLAPYNAEAYVELGVLHAADAPTVGERSDGGEEEPKEDAAVAAWTAAAKLAPTFAEAHHLLAVRLSAGGPAGRKRAITHAKQALGLEPKRASSYDTLASALLTGTSPANLTKAARQRLRTALMRQVRLHNATSSHDAVAADDVDTTALARAHYRLFHLVASDQSFGDENASDTPALGAMAVQHLRAAAALRPVQYADEAKKVQGWEEAERLSREADRRDRLQREAMVGAMHREIEGKREEAEEDEQVKAEEARERAAKAAARAEQRAPAKARTADQREHKSELRL